MFLSTHFNQEQLNKLVSEATASGYRLEIHAIGDAAADAVLTSLEEEKIAPEKRPIMVHCQVMEFCLWKYAQLFVRIFWFCDRA